MMTKHDLHSDYSQVPAELKQRQQWVCHRNKIPYNACTGKHASSTDPTTWSTFEVACTAYLDSTNNFSGIGYVFSKDDPYIGIDMDKCRDKATGEVLAWAHTYRALLNSYTELSPSETGFHVFVRADLLLERHKLDHVEMYEKERYFTVTGRHVDGTPFTIEERTSELKKMYDMVFHAKTEQNVSLLNYIPLVPSDNEIHSTASPAQGKNNVPLQGYTPLTPSDSEIASIAFPEQRESNAHHQSRTPIMFSDDDDDDGIITLIRNTRQAEKFEALWLGDTSSYQGDESRADLALCSLLAFYCGPGAQMQVDRMFQRSGLMRPKWNQQRGNQTYGQRTIEFVYIHRTTFYRKSAHYNQSSHTDAVTFTNEPTENFTNIQPESFTDIRPENFTDIQQERLNNMLPENFANLPQPDASFVKLCLEKEEYGDSLLFAYLFEDKLIYDHTEKSWYCWQGHYWKREKIGVVKQIAASHVANQYLFVASDTLRSAANGSQEETRAARAFAETCTRRATQLRGLQRTANVLLFASTYPAMAILSEEWDTHPWWLGTPNGVIDLESGMLRDGEPDDRIRTVVDAEWLGLDTPCPRFERFLREIFDDQPEKEELIGYLHRLLGYGITGLSDESVLPILYGEEGRNGKSTLIRHLGRVLGNTSGSISNDTLIDSKGRVAGSAQPYLVELQSKRLVWASETTEGARFNVGQVKLITGGDVINARGLYENNRTFKPTHTVLLLTNHKPHADSSDRAFWERVKLISFNLRFVENPTQDNERPIDHELDEALESEKSGILAWLVRGCIEYQAQGLSTPKCIVAATSEYHKQEDVIGQFLEEECIEGDLYRAEAKRFYETYCAWSKAQNIYPMSGKAFARRIERRFYKKRTKHGNLYIGVGIVDKDFSDGELDLDDTPLP